MNNRDNRVRGYKVYPMPEAVNGPSNTYALGIRADGTVRMIHTEGVQYRVSDDKPWCWTDYDPTQPTWTPEELVSLADDNNAVDLADWVRVFGARLESNFYLCTAWFDGKMD